MVLPGLLKESWNYWLSPATVSEVRVSTAGDRVESGAGAWRGDCSRSTLLGPEATRLGAGHGPGMLFVSGVVFENCRVDASIFVVKLLRAHGGCLGFRSR